MELSEHKEAMIRISGGHAGDGLSYSQRERASRRCCYWAGRGGQGKKGAHLGLSVLEATGEDSKNIWVSGRRSQMGVYCDKRRLAVPILAGVRLLYLRVGYIWI